MRKQYVAGLLILSAVSFVGCSSDSEAASPPKSAAASQEAKSAGPTASPAPSETQTEAAAPETAMSVSERLQAKVPSISAVTEVTEVNDSNGLIGRPGQYISAAWIADVAADPAQTGIDGGAVVEVFSNEADAQTRSDYIQETLKSMGPAFGTEYHYMDGTVLLRVSGVLMPSQATLYEQAFTE